ncbi:DUF924 family protein [Vibrio sonorensis]|uniref:DUF924 family protein n=1 Tax=Vibrio sonorensis TaxID=1004316 RepID=UPI0008DA1531|nr:DUF924 family protein [Vibrio sonorensis]
MQQDVIDFWFSTLTPKDWFTVNPELDKTITAKFGSLLKQAAQCELFAWRGTPEGRLAEIIVLDQFSRNIHRNTPLAFAQDPLALALAQQAIDAGDDMRLPAEKRAFAYLPFMHSESKLIHEQAVTLFSQQGMENNLEFEHKHKVIIDRFARYPHRNAVLNRQSTEEELAFLQQPNSSF